jgi:hypothetical protein
MAAPGAPLWTALTRRKQRVARIGHRAHAPAYDFFNRLEHRKTLRRQADTSADYNTVMVCRSQVTLHRLPSGFIGADEAQIALPSSVRHLLQRKRDARPYLLGAHSAGQSRIDLNQC